MTNSNAYRVRETTKAESDEKGTVKQAIAPTAECPVAFGLNGSSWSRRGPYNSELDMYSPTSTGKREREVHFQLGICMDELRSALGHRTHTFGCLLRGKKLAIKYADPYGLIQSDEVDFTQPDGEKRMATVIVALAVAKRVECRRVSPTPLLLVQRGRCHLLPRLLILFMVGSVPTTSIL
jgi:hypothetical protein